MNLDNFWEVLVMMHISLAMGRLDTAATMASVVLTKIATETEAAGLYYGPRYPA